MADDTREDEFRQEVEDDLRRRLRPMSRSNAGQGEPAISPTQNYGQGDARGQLRGMNRVQERSIAREEAIESQQQRRMDGEERVLRQQMGSQQRSQQQSQSALLRAARAPIAAAKMTAQGVGAAYRGTQAAGRAASAAGEAISRNSVKYYGTLFLLTYVINIADGFLNYTRITYRVNMYLLLAFLGWVFVFREIGDTWRGHLRTATTSLVVAIAAFLYPIILLTLPNYAPIDIELCRILANLFPFYLLYLFFFERDTECQTNFIIKWSKRVYFVTIIFIVLAMIPALVESKTLQNIPYLQPAKSAQVYGTYANYINLVTSGWDWLSTTATGTAKKDIDKMWELQKKQALGDLYLGEVDDKAEQRLGVELVDVKSAQKQFTTFDDVEVIGTLKVVTLDKNLVVSLNCTSDKDIRGKIPKAASRYTPDSTFSIQRPIGGEQSEYVGCIFPKGELEHGSHTITLATSFDFRTSAYMQSYFIESKRAEAVKANGENLVKHFQIDKNAGGQITNNGEPKTIYTSGPVNIGIGVPNLVTEVDIGEPNKIFNMRVSFTNMWGSQYGGKLKNLRDWYIQIPKEMEIIEDSTGEIKCSGKKFTLSGCPADDARCDKVNFKTYKLDPRVKIGDVDLADTVTCTIMIPGNGFNDLLGSTPISPRQFRTWMTYDYAYERNINVQIKQEEVAGGG